MTRRCTQRQFLLKPSVGTNQIIQYCLALAATQTGVQLHTVCVMSNHWHGVVSDPFARLPEFLERFHRLVARAQNAALGRWENLWSSDKPSVVHLASDEDILQKMAYTLANPTAAGLVPSPNGWPGVITTRLRERRQVRRPNVFFDPNGALPDSVVFETTRPAIYPQLEFAELARCLNETVQRLIRNAHDALLKAGKRFVGAQEILRADFHDRPTNGEPRRRCRPRIAAKDTSQRVDAIERLKAFLHDYRVAWQAWRHGQRDQVFPAGTYALRIYARVACRPP